MRFVASARNVARLVRYAAAVLLSGSVVAYSAGAVGTQINTNICHVGSHATLLLVSPPDNTVVGESSIILEGEVSLVSQLTVKIDGQYVDTVPLPNGATTFSHTVSLSPGEHTLRLEGQDICQTTTPVAEVTITYKPDEPPKPITGQQPVITSGTPTASSQSSDNVAGERLSTGAQQQARPLELFDMPLDWLYQVLVALDFVQPGSSQELLPMTVRFFGLLLGLVLIIFAGTVLQLLRKIARVARLKLARVPGFLTARPLLWIRLIGIGVIATVFLLLN